MRIERLELTRYGAFTDHVIDFGVGNTPSDLHIVFGLNEAGKSTIRDAVIDFLYGFPPRTPYSFLHANDALQIAATMMVGETTHRFVRVKRAKTSLLTPDNQPASEDVVKSVLGDISRAGFENMFSLDEDTLEKGGESILRNEGDLGELLFSAASGLSSLSSALVEIRAETATFYKKPGRSHRLAEMKKELAKLRSKIHERDISPSQCDRLVKEEKAERERHEQAKSERDEQAARAAQLKLLLDALEPWREYKTLSHDLSEVEDAPDLAPGQLEKAERLSIASAKTKTTANDAMRAVERTRTALNAIDVVQEILALGSRIDRLAKDDNEAKFRTSKDIGSRTRELSALNDDMQVFLRRLGAQKSDDPEMLLLPAATVGRIKELIEPLSGLEADVRTADEEVERTQESLEQAKKLLAESERSTDLAALAETLAVIRDDGDDRDRAQLDKRCRALEADLHSALMAMTPWTGEASALVNLPVPDNSIVEALKRDEAEVNESLTELTRDADRLQDESSRLSAEINAEAATAGVIDDARADEVRAARDAAWRSHRDSFDGGRMADLAELQATADSVESAIAEDDQVTGTRLLQSTEIAAIRKLKTDLARTDAAITRNASNREKLERQDEDIAKRTAELSGALTLPADTEPAFIDSWLNKRVVVVAKSRELKETASEREQLTRRIDSATETLSSAMADAGRASKNLDWRTCIKRCETAIEEWREQVNEQSTAAIAVKSATTELKARKGRHSKAQDALNAWRTSWTEVLGTCWLGAGDREPTPSEATEILDTLDELVIKLDKARDLSTRIEAMQANRDAYTDEVEVLATDSGATFDKSDPLKTADQLRDRLSTARENERRFQEKTDELAEAEDRLEEADIAQTRIDSRFAEIAAVFPADDFDTMLAGMRQAEQKAALQEKIGKLGKQLTTRLSVSAFDEAERYLTDQVSEQGAPAVIESEYDTLIAGGNDLNEHVSSLFHDWKKAESALAAIGGDAEVARLEEQVRVLLLDVRAEAARFMSLSAGALVVDRALSTYLNAHRSSMLERASEAFSAITRGAFTGLDAMPGKNSEVLVGLRSNGSSLIATEMSRGTRFQLYLSLRVAGYREFVKHREPLPFFGDDILETFDDKRSSEAISLMADMGKEGQVIYFTHHHHICDIAERVCDGHVMIHELPDLAVR